MNIYRVRLPRIAAAAAVWVATATGALAQPSQSQADYIMGPQDVLTITSYDQPELSGRFTVETDGTFTYPFIGRVRAGGVTLRAFEEDVKRQLVEQGFFMRPQMTVVVSGYKSQKIFIVGEVRQPGAYPLSGDMPLIEALALAGSTSPGASGEVVIAHARGDKAERVSLRDMETGLAPLALLTGGDTVFVLRAENVFVFGYVKNPGAYLLHAETMVLQALSLAGGLTDRAASSRIDVVRIANGQKRTFRVALTDLVEPGDTIVVPQRFF